MIRDDADEVAGSRARVSPVDRAHRRVFLRQPLDDERRDPGRLACDVAQHRAVARRGDEAARAVVGQRLAAAVEDDAIARRTAHDARQHRQRAVVPAPPAPSADLRAIEVGVVAGTHLGQPVLLHREARGRRRADADFLARHARRRGEVAQHLRLARARSPRASSSDAGAIAVPGVAEQTAEPQARHRRDRSDHRRRRRTTPDRCRSDGSRRPP